jgi:3D (Asp-Asp-Asp) domain-containing protein
MEKEDDIFMVDHLRKTDLPTDKNPEYSSDKGCMTKFFVLFVIAIIISIGIGLRIEKNPEFFKMNRAGNKISNDSLYDTTYNQLYNDTNKWINCCRDTNAAICKIMRVQYKYDTIKYKTIITMYNPEVKQCDATPFKTADGSTIDPKNPQRWVALSRDLLKIFPYGSKIMLKSKNAPIINGEYEVHDTGIKNGVDILIANPNVCRLEGCWDGEIYKVDTFLVISDTIIADPSNEVSQVMRIPNLLFYKSGHLTIRKK